MSGNWNMWKITAIAMALIMGAALVIGLVVANWVGDGEKATGDAQAPSAPAVSTPSAPAVGATRTLAVPPQAAVNACNRYAASQTGDRDKTAEVVKDAAVGAVVGAAGGASAGGGRGAGRGAALGGVVGAGGGTLYGLDDNKKHDERYREAYAGCMRARGYSW